MKILVTGATGFVGSHLVEKLFSMGHEVVSLVRNLEKYEKLGLPGQFLQGDLSNSSVDNWIENLPEDLDAFIHTAGIVHSFQSNSFYNINTEATKSLFNKLKKQIPKLNFVFISSMAASGPSKSIETPLTEETPLDPPSDYGKSKMLAEKFLLKHTPDNWALTIIRPPMVIGPRDEAVLDVFKMVKSRVVLNTGIKGSKKTYSFICVFDLVDAIIKTLEKRERGKEIYFVSFPKAVQFKEIIGEIAKQMKVGFLSLPLPFFIINIFAKILRLLNRTFGLDFRLTPDKTHELKPSSWVCSSQKSEQQLEMTYRWDLEKTIKVTLKDYKERGWI